MAMNTVRRIASEILGVGESKVKFRIDSTQKISEALTREDIRALIKEGAIFAQAKMGVSRIRGREKREQIRKGRRSGKGSKKGTFAARLGEKSNWIAKVRAQRRHLFSLVASGKLAAGAKRRIYGMIKGNAFKGVKVLDIYLKDNKLLVEKKQ
jgi:large subunit ribosomal protein L19e